MTIMTFDEVVESFGIDKNVLLAYIHYGLIESKKDSNLGWYFEDEELQILSKLESAYSSDCGMRRYIIDVAYNSCYVTYNTRNSIYRNLQAVSAFVNNYKYQERFDNCFAKYEKLLTPKLCHTMISYNSTGYVYFLNKKENRIEGQRYTVSEDSVVYDVDDTNFDLSFIDNDTIGLVKRNADAIKVKSQYLEDYIKDSIYFLKLTTEVKCNYWLLKNDNLNLTDEIVNYLKSNKIEIYNTEFIDEKEILIGNSSQRGSGVYFLPYCLEVYNTIKNKIECWYSRVSLRNRNFYRKLIIN